MTPQLEKVFFNFVLKNLRYFNVVHPYFFNNPEIKMVYEILRNYILTCDEPTIPSNRQILDLVTLEDENGVITKDILKSILNVEFEDYDLKNFIIPNFNAWVLSNRIKVGVSEVVDETRKMNPTVDSITNGVDNIKSIIQEATKIDFLNDDDDLGSDFDSPDSHFQDSSRYKIPSGIAPLDHILGGGWDVGTLNILMAETNNGKSLWMQNLAVLSANAGKNVLYITLEMSEAKVMKRLGAMRLHIPINDYDQVSQNREYIREKIENLSNTVSGGDLFEKKVGKIYTKFWAAGTANTNDFDTYLHKVQDRTGMKFDLIIVDYITLIASGKVLGDSLYTKGKALAENLRAIASKWAVPVITGIQVAKDSWNSADITLASVPESKAIAETADTFFAIIRTEHMKANNDYKLKLLKQRDGDFSRIMIKLKLNTRFLTLEDAQFDE